MTNSSKTPSKPIDMYVTMIYNDYEMIMLKGENRMTKREEAEKVYQEAIAPAEKVYQEATAQAYKVYQEAIAPADKVYQEARAQAWKIYREAIA